MVAITRRISEEAKRILEELERKGYKLEHIIKKAKEIIEFEEKKNIMFNKIINTIEESLQLTHKLERYSEELKSILSHLSRFETQLSLNNKELTDIIEKLKKLANHYDNLIEYRLEEQYKEIKRLKKLLALMYKEYIEEYQEIFTYLRDSVKLIPQELEGIVLIHRKHVLKIQHALTVMGIQFDELEALMKEFERK